jgi:hypothetical protein
MNYLPDDVLEEIFSYLDYNELKIVAAVCER